MTWESRSGSRRAGVHAAMACAVILAIGGGCSAAPAGSTAGAAAPSSEGSPATTPAPTATRSTVPSPSPIPSPAGDPWELDLAQLDAAVRTEHVAPFVIHTEAEWSARLVDVRERIAGAAPNEQLVLIASLVGLLDTHSALVAGPREFQYYPMVLYGFADGWFVVLATDRQLVGSRVVSIGGVAMDDVIARLTPLVAHDNESGLLEGLEWLVTSPEYLHGAGIIADPEHAGYVLEQPDGTTVTVDPVAVPQSAWERDLATIGWLMGAQPEAVARRGERIWTRLDTQHRVFLVSVNDYGDMRAETAAMTASLDDGSANRVVLDMRYLRGGDGNIAIVDAMVKDPRIVNVGGLTVLIGRENISAGTAVANRLATMTKANLVGEPTPARADNFLCPCVDVRLANSGYVITLPTATGRNGDPRPAVEPDVRMVLSAKDFFAGRDPVLEAALAVPGPKIGTN